MRTPRMWALVMITAVLSISGWAKKPSSVYKGVEVVFWDRAGDRITSDTGAPYRDKINNVLAEIRDDGALNFFACHSSAKEKTNCPDVGTRTVSLDFTDQADPAGPNALGLPFLTNLVDTSIGSNPRDANGALLDGGFPALMTGPCQQRLARMKVNFNDGNGLMYTIRFRPANEPDSNWVLVTYLGGEFPCFDPDNCAEWTVESVNASFIPDEPGECFPTGVLEDIGTLLSDNTNDEGDYHLPFGFTVTALPQPQDEGGSGGGGGGGKGGGKPN